MKHKEFTLSDVNIILNMPEKEYIDTLLSLVNLTDKERETIDMYYFKGLRDIDIAEKHGKYYYFVIMIENNSNNITKIIQAIPNILKQAQNKYVDDNSIIQIAKSQGIDLNKVLSVISQYENNIIVVGIAKKFGVDIVAVKNKIQSLVNR